MYQFKYFVILWRQNPGRTLDLKYDVDIEVFFGKNNPKVTTENNSISVLLFIKFTNIFYKIYATLI